MSRMWPEGGTTRLADAALATGISCLPVRKRSAALAGLCRLHEPRRDDDREVGLLLLEGGRAEQSAEDRHVAEPRQLLLGIAGDALEEPGDREALAVAQLDYGRGPAHRDRRDRDDAGADRVRRVDVADLGLDLEVDDAVGEDRRLEGQADAEL